MNLNKDQFLEEGYLVLRNIIPPERLEELRTAYELMVERQTPRLPDADALFKDRDRA